MNDTKTLYDYMDIPESCCVGKRIPKKLFRENADLTATDKRALREDIQRIICEYTLNSKTIPVQKYSDRNREYSEFEILQVNLKNSKRFRRISEFINRAIPYPLIIVFKRGKCEITLSFAHKRYSKSEKGAFVAEDYFFTEWLKPSEPTPIQKNFLESLCMKEMPQKHIFALYSAFIDRVIALNCASFTGIYRLETKAEKLRKRRERLAQCRQLENRISDLKAAIKKEEQFNRQVELNMEIKNLEKGLKETAGQL